MNELQKLLAQQYTFIISETSIELCKYLSDTFKCKFPSDIKKEDKIAVLSLLLYREHKFEIVVSENYTTSDHQFYGITNSFPCKTVFIHSSIDEFEKNMQTINAFFQA